MFFCVVEDGPNVTLLVVDASFCTSVDTSTDVVPTALMNSLCVSEAGSASFLSVDWLVFMEL